MDPLAERVEVLAAVLVEEHDLAVEDVAPGGELELREVAPERAPVAGLEIDLRAVDEGDGAEAVPLGFKAPSVAGGEGFGGTGELGEHRGHERERHAPSKSDGASARKAGGARRSRAGP